MGEEQGTEAEQYTDIYLEESRALRETESALGEEAALAGEKVRRAEDRYQELKQSRQDNYYELDGREHLEIGRLLRGLDRTAAETDAVLQRLLKLKASPYFARIDFREQGMTESRVMYIGSFGFRRNGDILIYDWRAPVSSLFYDCEPGPAAYSAPDGEISGELTRKRQLKVRDGKLLFALDSSETVSDEVLQEELSRSSDRKMKTIISTIQKEQNRVIRSGKPRTMIIEGAAGSGKTAVALHRIAFLLYRYHEKLKAENVLIISPNHVFSDYISGVIPELGEEPVRQEGFFELALENLRGCWILKRSRALWISGIRSGSLGAAINPAGIFWSS